MRSVPVGGPENAAPHSNVSLFDAVTMTLERTLRLPTGLDSGGSLACSRAAPSRPRRPWAA
eukprot:3209551-Prymnesium_polylepis.1